MAYPVFTPPGIVDISPGSTLTVKPRVRRAGFGDGYSQRTGDGLNAINRECSAVFSVLTSDEADALTSFFEERAGYKPFLWTLPGESVERKWIASEWQKTYADGAIDISAAFEEVFDP
ncbi:MULTISPECIES: phage tail protein [Chelativorans]|jgi:phage-related protein|uniref:Phage minor tail n=1 Tax=Chelativorans sp. (strain BNC1) TaxID=266779 RepID=Q11H49_CHESB|nr:MULTISPECIES: phage tail protein [Chelativorans]